LPYNEQYPKQVREIASQVINECENFVVLGIGGSALGNIALQTALNPNLYNLDAAQRKGPRLFVFDNVDPMQLASSWIGLVISWIRRFSMSSANPGVPRKPPPSF
jgi:glucose-6-phosphate isomerase